MALDEASEFLRGGPRNGYGAVLERRHFISRRGGGREDLGDGGDVGDGEGGDAGDVAKGGVEAAEEDGGEELLHQLLVPLWNKPLTLMQEEGNWSQSGTDLALGVGLFEGLGGAGVVDEDLVDDTEAGEVGEEAVHGLRHPLLAPRHVRLD